MKKAPRLLREAEDLARQVRKACQGAPLKAVQDPSARELILPPKLVPPPYFARKDPCHNIRGLRAIMGVQSDPQTRPAACRVRRASNEVVPAPHCWPSEATSRRAGPVGPTEHP